MLSTDKAAYPVNAMGMSKGLMEKVAIARSRVAADKGCTLCVTRYGNVMASRGSVIPLFVEQIRQGQPLTVTDPQHDPLHDVAGRRRGPGALCLSERLRPATCSSQKAPAATIGTLAEAVKRVFQADNPVRVIGTRHGEKLYETLLTREEMVRADRPGRLLPRAGRRPRSELRQVLLRRREPAWPRSQDYHSHNVAAARTSTRWSSCS